MIKNILYLFRYLMSSNILPLRCDLSDYTIILQLNIFTSFHIEEHVSNANCKQIYLSISCQNTFTKVLSYDAELKASSPCALHGNSQQLPWQNTHERLDQDRQSARKFVCFSLPIATKCIIISKFFKNFFYWLFPHQNTYLW